MLHQSLAAFECPSPPLLQLDTEQLPFHVLPPSRDHLIVFCWPPLRIHQPLIVRVVVFVLVRAFVTGMLGMWPFCAIRSLE